MRTQGREYQDEGKGRYRRLRPGPGLSRDQVAAHQRGRLQRATIELVASHGYEALTVRALAKRARISNGTFYGQYRSTDDCFTSTYHSVCRYVTERMIEAVGQEPEARRRLTLAIDRLFRDMADAPLATTFMLRAAPAAGPAFGARLRSSAMQLGVALDLCLSADAGLRLPPPLLEGAVGGLARVGRVILPTIAEDEVEGLADEVAEWIVSLCLPPAAAAGLPIAPARPHRETGISAAGRLRSGEWGGDPGETRSMAIATAYQIAKSGYHRLSVPRICREAGVSRRDFQRHFKNLEDCLTSALEQRVAAAIVVSVRGEPSSTTWSTAVWKVVEALCAEIEADPDGARVLFAEIFAAGTSGVDSRDRQISRVAQTLRFTAPEGRRPSQLSAEASTAAGWAILGSRASEESIPAAALLPLLAFLALAPTVGAAEALGTIQGEVEQPAGR